MTAAVRTTAVGVFTDLKEAERAVEDLRRGGFPDADIGFVARNPTPPVKTSPQPADSPPAPPPPAHHPHHGTHAAEGAAAGAIAGGTIGTLAGLAVVLGLIPAVGPVLAGGLLAGFAASVGTGVGVGGAIGALIGLEFPEDEAGFYEKELHEGRVLVTVKAGPRYDEAVAVLRRHGAYGRGGPLI